MGRRARCRPPARGGASQTTLSRFFGSATTSQPLLSTISVASAAGEHDGVLAPVRAEAALHRVLPDQGPGGEIINGDLCIGRLGVVFEHILAAAGHDAPRPLRPHRPQRDVDQMHAPVRHQPPGVVPEPAEVEMEPVPVEGPLRRRAQPHLVVDTRRHGLVGRGCRSRSPSPGRRNSAPGARGRSCRREPCRRPRPSGRRCATASPSGRCGCAGARRRASPALPRSSWPGASPHRRPCRPRRPSPWAARASDPECS